MSKFQSPSLEITVVSAEGLRHRNRSITKNAFVTVRTDPTNYVSTTEDQDGGSCPSWNERLHVALPATANWTVDVEVRRRTSSSGSQLIAVAHIPKSDIVGDYIPPNHLRFLSYRLRGSDGARNGIINLSIRMVGHLEIGHPAIPTVGKKSSSNLMTSSCGGAVTGIPMGVPYVHHGTARGIPVWLNYWGDSFSFEIYGKKIIVSISNSK